MDEERQLDPCLKNKILALFRKGQVRLTPVEVRRLISSSPSAFTRRQVESTLKELVAAGHLIYTSRFSISHLELNRFDDIQISHRLRVISDSFNAGIPGIALVRIHRGASFGMGDHPTTRLALKGVDHVACLMEKEGTLSAANILDIGTGSGVLAIAAIQLGAGRALALDIDPVARYEAAANVRLNGLEDRVVISGIPLEDMPMDKYEMILANLRPPTLKKLFSHMLKMSASTCYWVLSGFRPDERHGIEKQLNAIRFQTIWGLNTDNWTALAAKFEK